MTRGVLSPDEAARFVDDLERAIIRMAAELNVDREAYLSAVCRWSTPHPVVQQLVTALAPRLSVVVSEHLGLDAKPSRASVFRKSAAAHLGTHGHQDAGYWVFSDSRRYDLTTWVALDCMDEASGALILRRGSHRESIAPPVDYLRSGFEDPAARWTDGETVPVRTGDVVTFHPSLWHASHGMAGGGCRRALAIRWVPDRQHGEHAAEHTAGGPFRPNPQHFGMYTSGALLREALIVLGADVGTDRLDEAVEAALSRDTCAGLPAREDARRALERLSIYLRASRLHHAAEQRGMVWEPVRDCVIAPLLGQI